ncbi:BTAD domain-containing putative transcriptional regulator [Pseudonocardia sp.]|uniref:BTAD domain-containing putative transcriptional regulator n=1 Tax=Pseudonocardia sp. TaxID=60912 RepID=UPI0031FD1623
MDFRILGPFEVCHGGERIRIGPPKQRAVLAVLLVHANQVVAVDRLIDLLWGEEPPARAGGALQAYMHNLRRVLEPARPRRSPPILLVTQAPGYLLRVGPQELDATRFQALASEGRRLLAESQPETARQRLTEALALWRGPAPLVEFAHEPFAQAAAARLKELREVAIEDRLEAELATGGHVEAVAELEVLVGQHPLRERLWGLLMVALYQSGRQGDALRAGAKARNVLREDLGVEPGPALRRIQADILAQAPSLEPRAPSESSGPIVVSSASAPPLRPDPPEVLVGRERPLATLLDAVESARRGSGQLVLISGEAGIGKTRLLEELASRAAATGATVAWGRGYEGAGTPAFWPWVQTIRGLLGQMEADTARAALATVAGEIAQIAPEVRELVGETGPTGLADPAAARFRLYGAVTDVIHRLAIRKPVLVLLDDLHWVDVASLELTRFLATHLEPAAILLVGTYRPGDVLPGHALAATLGELARLPRVTRLSLEGLSEPDVARFIAETTAVEPSSAVVAEVHHRTNGNPFFVAELARLLAAEGVLGAQGGIGIRIPTSVRDVIRRRLTRLPELTNQLLGAAAVVGPDFDLAVVAQAAEVDQLAALELMDLAVASHIVLEDPETVDGFRFSHTLLQQTVYAELGRARRAQLHARAAEILHARWGEDPSRAVELARHWFHAAPVAGPEPGIAAAVRAADVAQVRLAYEQAEDQLRRALELLERMPPGPDRSRTELSVQNRLAAVLTQTQGYASKGVAEAWGRARELCRDASTAADLLPSLWGLFTASLSTLQLRATMEVAGQLRELARSRIDPSVPLAGHLASGIALFHSGELVAARHECEQAVAACDSIDDLSALISTFVMNPAVIANGYLGMARWLLGDRRCAREITGRTVDIADRHGHRFGLANALYFDGWLAILEGDTDSVRQRVEQIRANQRGSQEAAGMAMTISGWSRGPEDYARAHAELRQAITDLRSNGFRLSATLYIGFLADLHLRAQRAEAALAAAEEALAEVEATGERFYEADLHRLRGEALALLPGRAQEAESSLRRAVAVAESQQAISLQRRANASLASLTEAR